VSQKQFKAKQKMFQVSA